MTAAKPRTDDRIFGLDLMRTAAIVGVVMAHGRDLLGAYVPFEPVVPGIDPVDLFFVLSGYLIGGLLLRLGRRDDLSAKAMLLGFWQRRWFRTLPNYYLFLVLNIVLVLGGVMHGVVNHNAPAYFVLLQNFVKPLDLFFFESWSVAVEVWYYTLFPLLLLFFLRGLRLDLKRAYLFSALMFLIGPALVRPFFAEGVHTLGEADALVRRLVVTRQDTIAFGALAAWVHAYFPIVWRRGRWPLFIGGLALLLYAMRFRSVEHLQFLNTWFLTITALTMAALLPLLEGWRDAGRPGIPITVLSRISYALFLVHLPLRAIFLPWVGGRSFSGTVALYVCWWITAIVLSAIVYRFYEKPFQDLRDRSGPWRSPWVRVQRP